METKEVREAVTLMNKGEKIFGIFHRPVNREKVPAVLFCYGFAGNKCGKYRLLVRLAEDLVKNGIAVLRFDYRGAGDSEGDFLDMTVEGKISDIQTCLEYLQKDSQIDSQRIGLFGRSLGGAIAIAAARKNTFVKSLVLWAPVYNSVPWQKLWDSFQTQRLDEKQKHQIQNLPGGIPNLTFLKQFFQLSLENELKFLKEIPLLHIEGDQDTIVQSEHGQAYRLARKGLDNTKFLTLPNSDHDFSDGADQEVAIKETSLWFQKTL